MSYNNDIAEIRNGLTGDCCQDMIYLRNLLRTYMYVENSGKVRQEIIRMMYANLSDSERVMPEQQYIGLMSLLSTKYREFTDLFDDDQYEKALKIADEIISAAEPMIQGDPDEGCFSFNEAFDYFVYLSKHQDVDAAAFAPLPMSEYYLQKANCLIYLDRIAEAQEVVADALRWNPVGSEAYIAAADCLSALGDMDGAWEQLRKAHSCAYRSEARSHVYTTAGEMLLSEEKTEDAILMFWMSSWATEDKDTYEDLLTLIEGLSGSFPKRPSSKKFENTMNKFGLSLRPHVEMAHLASEIGEMMEKNEKYVEAYYYYDIAYGLTLNAKIGQTLVRIQAKIEAEEK